MYLQKYLEAKYFFSIAFLRYIPNLSEDAGR